MGSKNRLAKHILPIITQDRKNGQPYIEPFVGGANIIDKADGWRIGADSNKYLIAFWQAFVTGWKPPQQFTEEQYKYVRDNKDEDPVLTGYVSHHLSFGGKWFGGWSRNKKGTDYVMSGYRHIMKQRPGVSGVQFTLSDYRQLHLPENSLVYCDPPYAGTTKYKSGFDHDEFWEWVFNKAGEGHTLFVSEYTAPEKWTECIWQKDQRSALAPDDNSTKATEKLFKVVVNKWRGVLARNIHHRV